MSRHRAQQRVLAGVLAAVVSLAAVTPALAADPAAGVPPRAAAPATVAATPAPAPSTLLEMAIGVGQSVAGGLVAFGLFAAAMYVGDIGESLLVLPFVFGGPAVVGGAVCWIGGASPAYDGTCGAAVVGAYLGALSMIPLAVLGAKLGSDDPSDGDHVGGFYGVLGGLLLGWLVVQPLTATVGWHLGKQPRRGTVSALPPPRRLLTMPRERRAQRAPGEVTVPLLSFGF